MVNRQFDKQSICENIKYYSEGIWDQSVITVTHINIGYDFFKINKGIVSNGSRRVPEAKRKIIIFFDWGDIKEM